MECTFFEIQCIANTKGTQLTNTIQYTLFYDPYFLNLHFLGEINLKKKMKYECILVQRLFNDSIYASKYTIQYVGPIVQSNYCILLSMTLALWG